MRKPLFFALAAAALVAQTTRSVWDGVFSSDQAGRGRQVYNEECASCHGTDLTGGESAPPLPVPNFFPVGPARRSEICSIARGNPCRPTTREN